MDAFDADVLIYAANPRHELGPRVRAMFTEREPDTDVGVGSVLLLPEVLARPTRLDDVVELSALAELLGQLDLRSTDEATATYAASLGAAYGLRAVDAVHLATAVMAGADRFITNNRRDFPTTIREIDVTYPADLPER